MTQVTIALPVHDESVTGRIRWADTGGLGDISTLEATPGTAVLRRFQIRANGQDASNHVQVQSNGPELSADWEGSAVAVIVQVAGLDNLVIVGPTNSLIASADSSEPYQWVPGNDYNNGAITYLYSVNDQPAGLAAWVEDFKGAYSSDNTLRATLVLDDGVGVTVHFGDGTPIVAHGSLGEATGTVMVVHFGDGTPIVGEGFLGEATGFVTAAEPVLKQLDYQTPLEVDLQYAASRLERDYAFSDFYDPLLCPYYLLPYLAAWDAADLYYEGFDEAYARATVESAPVINTYRWAERAWDEHTTNLGCIAVRSPVLSGSRIESYEITVIPNDYPPANDADREYYRKSYEAITDLPVSEFTILDEAFLSDMTVGAMIEVMTITPIFGDAV